jgi:subtilase family serine protease
LTFTGNAAQASQAFHTEIHSLTQNGVRHYANVSEIAVPKSLASLIQSVRGLDDFKPHSHVVQIGSKGSPQFTNASGNHGLAPGDIATIYDIQGVYQAGVDGSGVTVAVVGQTDIDLADITAYRTAYNLPVNLPTIVLVAGSSDPGSDVNDLMEADLDIEVLGAGAPKAALIYVNSNNALTSLQYAIDQNLAQVVNMSYGGCEPDIAVSGASYQLLAEQANAQGITLLATSGDAGAADCDTVLTASATHGLAVDFPASIPEFTAVGGTSFTTLEANYFGSTNNSQGGSALSYIPEVAWNETAFRSGILASGGGASTVYAKPSWQQGNGVPTDGYRDVPDVAFFAMSTESGYIVCTGGDCASGTPNFTTSGMLLGGTSASTPVFAGIVTLLNNYLLSNGEIPTPGLGNINPHLYSLADTTSDVFHDITQGNNIVPCTANTVDCTIGSYGYSAGAGYDQVTGLGSVNTYNFLREWNSAALIGSSLALSTSSATIVDGSSVTLTATVIAASGTTTPTGTVTFYANNAAIGSADLSKTGVATLAISTLPAGVNIIQATYAGSLEFGQSLSSLSETVLVPTTTTLMTSFTQLGQGIQLTLSVSVLPASGTTATSGTVTVYNGTTQIGTAAVSGGSASFSTSTLPVGIASLSAAYSGSSTFAASTSAPVSVTISQDVPVGTTTTLTASPTQASQGTTITLTAAVSPATGTTTPTGVVTFYIGTTALGTASLSNGRASVTTSALPVGTDPLTASYAGNTAFSASTSAPVSVTISQDAPVGTTTTLTASATQAIQGTTITLTAAVSPAAGTTTPTGTVTFYSGTTVLGTAPLSNGTASSTTSTLPMGTDSLTASYAPSGAFSASTSAVVSVTITQAVMPDFTIAASASTLTVTGGQSASTTLTITPTNGFNKPLTLGCAGLPSGSSCTFGTAVAQVNGTSTISLSISTQTLTAASTQKHSPNAPLFALLPLALLLPMKRRKEFVKALQLGAAAFILIAIGVGATGCAGGASAPASTQPTSQTSTVTVTAQDQGGTSHALKLTLTVN